MKKLFNALMKILGYVPAPKLVKISYEEHLRIVPEQVIEKQVRTTLERARDFYAMRGRKILAVDLQTHLDFFDDAVGFDRLEHSPVLLPVNQDRN
jgi:hypothetical protein